MNDIVSQQPSTKHLRASYRQTCYRRMRRDAFGRFPKYKNYFSNALTGKRRKSFKSQRERFASVANHNGGADKGNGKLIISNLGFGVTDEDIRELFEDFGRLRRAVIHHDRSGRSLGTAEVTYTNRADAAKAIAQYNGLPLDGRPIQINIVTPSGGRHGGGGGDSGHFRGSGLGGGRRLRRVRGNRQPSTQVTKEQLDAELADYMSHHPN